MVRFIGSKWRDWIYWIGLVIILLLILQMSRAYATCGIASHYGGPDDKFHGTKTANGEIFSREAMTAAHKSLRFNTLLEVTNPSNGKKVIVRINDRGPYIKGRVLDLSYRAAQQLGLEEIGVAQVCWVEKEK